MRFAEKDWATTFELQIGQKLIAALHIVGEIGGYYLEAIYRIFLWRSHFTNKFDPEFYPNFEITSRNSGNSIWDPRKILSRSDLWRNNFEL